LATFLGLLALAAPLVLVLAVSLTWPSSSESVAEEELRWTGLRFAVALALRSEEVDWFMRPLERFWPRIASEGE